MPREGFLPPTPDGYRPLRTRSWQTPDGGGYSQLGVLDSDTIQDA